MVWISTPHPPQRFACGDLPLKGGGAGINLPLKGEVGTTQWFRVGVCLPINQSRYDKAQGWPSLGFRVDHGKSEPMTSPPALVMRALTVSLLGIFLNDRTEPSNRAI